MGGQKDAFVFKVTLPKGVERHDLPELLSTPAGLAGDAIVAAVTEDEEIGEAGFAVMVPRVLVLPFGAGDRRAPVRSGIGRRQICAEPRPQDQNDDVELR